MAQALRWLRNRWPTAIGLALFLPGALGAVSPDRTEHELGNLGGIFVLLPLVYLVLAKLRRRWATWPVVFAGMALVATTQAINIVEPAVLLTATAVVVLAWGAVDSQLTLDRTFQVQAVALGGFAAVTFAALALLTHHPHIAGYIVAAVWLAHGIWDFIHLMLDKVVSRSFAECCAVIDILVAVQILRLTIG